MYLRKKYVLKYQTIIQRSNETDTDSHTRYSNIFMASKGGPLQDQGWRGEEGE